MSFLTPPTDELNQIIKGDLDILNAYDSSNGTGSIYIRNGGLYVEGLTDLDQTTISTGDGKFNVLGANKVEFNISGGATSSIEMTAEDASFFTTTAGALTLSSTATDANGIVSITAAGNGPNSILINASNATDGQISLTSAGASTSTDAIKILASDTTDGNVLIQGSGNFTASNPAVKIIATNATSGQILVESAGGSTSSDSIKLLASDTTDGNVLIQGRGNLVGSNPAVKIYADNATSGQILVESASDATGSDSIKLNATGTTGGNVSITGSGSTSPAVLVDATSAASGKVLIRSAGGDAAGNAIELLASDTTDGNILIQANSTNTNAPSIKLFADNDTSGQVHIESDGNLTNAIRIVADNGTAGGIDIDATGLIAIDSSNISSGITIATSTAGVPVTIGTATSLVTIAGSLDVQGTTTTVNTETLTIEDNIIVLNSGNGELDLDAGIVVRRYQTANDIATGNVATGPDPIQESGAFQAGSATPGTLVLDTHASATNDFYKGWWIKITSGTGVDQIRRVASYVGATKTVTLYVTADNTSTFTDGLDLTTAPAAADTYELYSDSYALTYFDEGDNTWNFANSALIPDPVSAGGASIAAVQQYQEIRSGAVDIFPQIYKNVKGTASTTTITLTILGHDLIIGDAINVSDSTGFTPAITTGKYLVVTTPTVDTFTITVGASTTHAAGASVTASLMTTSKLKVNVIEPHDSNFGGIIIPGVSVYEDIIVTKTSTAYFTITSTALYGAYFILIGDLNNTDGTFATFTAARSTAGGGSTQRFIQATGDTGQKIEVDWEDGEKLKFRHKPAGVGAGTYTYRVRISSLL